MIVCICNALNDKKLASAAKQSSIEGSGETNVAAAPTVSEVFRRCGERPQCGKCLSHVAEIIEQTRPQHSAMKIAAE